VVSIHDVAPPFESDLRAQLSALEAIDLDRLVLKVVPRWHGDHRISEARSLIDAIKQKMETGSQIVLHGLEHQPRGHWVGSPSRVLRARLFAPGAAEFMTLSGREAHDSVLEGLDELRLADLSAPDTFCAPGWLMSDESRDAVARAGMRYLTGMFEFRDFSRGTTRRLASMGYMGAGDLQERGVRALNQMVAMGVECADGIKIYLHPDVSGRRRWQGTVDLVARLLSEGWRASTFHDFA
jgi:predicted deacetylase